jgi:hypothetical protein
MIHNHPTEIERTKHKRKLANGINSELTFRRKGVRDNMNLLLLWKYNNKILIIIYYYNCITKDAIPVPEL